MNLLNLSDEKLLKLEEKLQIDIDNKDITQYRFKIAMNALYGQFANVYSPFYDIRIAKSITKTGQVLIQQVGKDLSDMINKHTGNTTDLHIYGDTDSCYLSVDPIVKKKYLNKQVSKKESYEILKKIDKDLIEPEIKKIIQKKIVNRLNVMENTLEIAREKLIYNSIFNAKKRYICLTLDTEGFCHLPDGKIDHTGIINKKMPDIIVKWLNEMFLVMLLKNQKELLKFTDNKLQEFRKLSINNISIGLHAGDMEKYHDKYRDTVLKQCPIHVKAAIFHNKEVKKKGFDVLPIIPYTPIHYLYLKIPNPTDEKVIGFRYNSIFPFSHLKKYIDYELQFEKAFGDNIKRLANTGGWKSDSADLSEDLF